MFVMYYPQMIEAGMVYKAVPPLYSTKIGGKTRFFTEQEDMVKYVQKIFTSKYQLKDSSNKEFITNKQITNILMINADYMHFLEDISQTFALDPLLTEIILYNYVNHKDKLDIKSLTKEVSAKYRFMKVNTYNGIIVVEGTTDKCNKLIANQEFFNQCAPILNIIRQNSSLHYYINEKKYTLYELMNLYVDSYPSGVKRFKGLGEMSKDELVQSTLHPAFDRTLIRYTIDDIKETLNIIREYDSDTKKILNLVGNVRREDLLD